MGVISVCEGGGGDNVVKDTGSVPVISPAWKSLRVTPEGGVIWLADSSSSFSSSSSTAAAASALLSSLPSPARVDILALGFHIPFIFKGMADTIAEIPPLGTSCPKPKVSNFVPPRESTMYKDLIMGDPLTFRGTSVSVTTPVSTIARIPLSDPMEKRVKRVVTKVG